MSEWVELIEAEQARIAARLAVPAPEVTPAPWEPEPDLFNCYPLRSDWEQAKILENADGNPVRRYQNNWEDYWKQYNELVAGVEPYPEPVINSRQESAFLAPAPVLKLAEVAREAGWDVRMQYAQGYPPHGSTGLPGALKDSIAVIFGGHPLQPFRAGYACYEKTASGSAWSWNGIMIQGADVTPYAGCGIEELKFFLSTPDMTSEQVARWVSTLKERRAAQGDDAKRRTVMRKEIRDLEMAGESISRICEHAASVYSPEEVRKILSTVSKKAEKEGSR